MFIPGQWEAVQSWNEQDLDALPSVEDDHHEYKSSAITDDDIAYKLARAASAFWNSGGGLFVAGVNGAGRPDGGLSLSVGRQPRRDWLDQVIGRVTPPGRYAIKCIEATGSNPDISMGKAVVAIGFGASDYPPHMAPDNRYYIRAGAHTVPASHFIVEALRARRGLMAPMLSHIVREKPNYPGFMEVGVLALNDAPALQVEISLVPAPESFGWSGQKLPLRVPVVSRDAPFYFDYGHKTGAITSGPATQMCLRFLDVAGRGYSTTHSIEPGVQMGPNFQPPSDTKDIERALGKIADAVLRKK